MNILTTYKIIKYYIVNKKISKTLIILFLLPFLIKHNKINFLNNLINYILIIFI